MEENWRFELASFYTSLAKRNALKSYVAAHDEFDSFFAYVEVKSKEW